MSHELTALKRVARLRPGGTPESGDERYWAQSGDGVPWVSISDMSTTERVERTAREVSAAGIASARLVPAPPGTLLFAMYASVGAVSELGVRACWNQALLGIDPAPEHAERRFLKYWLASLRPSLGALVRSNTQDNLNADQVGNLPFPVLPTWRQAEVADYLDAETARIDQLSAARRRSLDQLQLRRAAVIESGVAGRALSADRRASRIAWLDTVPSDWQQVMLKLVARLGSGHTPSRSNPEWWAPSECTIPWITTGEVSQMRSDRVELITETRERISPIGLANSSAELCPPGTVVLCRTASAGYSAIMGTEMATSQDFVTWVCGPRLRPRYLLLCLRAMRPDLLGRLAMGSTHKTIYMPDIESIRIPLPPIDEQDAIVEDVYRRLVPIDRAVDAIERQVALLKEHRQALITAAVTGQLDVTKAVA